MLEDQCEWRRGRTGEDIYISRATHNRGWEK